VAYATGSAANLNEILAALQTFAAAQGWTIDKWTSGSNLLFMRKGQCFVAMQGATQALTTYPGGVSTAVTDTVLRIALSTSITTSLTTYNSHPGSIVTTATDNDRVEVNDLIGPFAAYHFFSGNEGAGDPAYIHVVIQTASDRYQHFSIGNLDKKGLSHAGVGYAVGANRYWYRNTAGTDLTSASMIFNDPTRHPTIFDGNNTTTVIGSATAQHHIPDALPVSWSAGVILGNYTLAGTAMSLPLVNRSMRPANYGVGSSANALLSNVVVSAVSQWSGNAVLWPLPVIIINPATSQLCYVGDYPNVRMLNMEGMGPGQEITYGSETWKVFPSMTQRAWGLDRTAGFDGATSGQYALAYKKVT